MEALVKHFPPTFAPPTAAEYTAWLEKAYPGIGAFLSVHPGETDDGQMRIQVGFSATMTPAEIGKFAELMAVLRDRLPDMRPV